mmetsp:Transcript_29057/g.72792  ORF Transcript_29057/g.72792 Transcript_29057/m.72792 type:complete len:511 (-) Transcript_29057:277-1809(-)
MAGVGRALCAEPAAAAAGGARVSTHVRRGGHGAARPRHLRRVALRSALNPHNSAAAAVGVFTDEKHKLGEDVTVDFSMEASPSILQTSDDFDESQLKLPEFEDIVAAYLRIKNAIPRTPCWQSEALSRLTGATVFLKGEHNQATGSFKERGARNAMLLLTADQKRRGVVAASAGNHGLALSYHGRNLKIPVTVVMPETAPLTKISRCEALGANVVLSGKNFTEAFAKACELRDADSLTYINGYDDPPILAGAGTVGMEILEQVDELDAVVIPVGGGGLIAGMALAIKAVKPEVQVIGVEPARVASFSAALHNGAPICVDPNGSTFADGLAVLKVGPHAFALARKYVDKVITISEKDIGLGVLRLIEEEKVVTEGGGATAVGALVTGHLPELKGKRVAVVLSGGNIDITTLGRVIERGLAADRRLVHFSVVVSDKPGGLAALMGAVADERASVKDIVHERAWLDDDVMTTEVQIVAETMGEEHVQRLHRRLSAEMEHLDSLILRWGSRTLL